MRKLLFVALAAAAAFAIAGIAINRGEPINAFWIIAAGACIYTLGYRFYAAWIVASVLACDATRATPAERLDNGRDYVPTPDEISTIRKRSALTIQLGNRPQSKKLEIPVDYRIHAMISHQIVPRIRD
jgi:hypothetical protein